MVGQVSVLYLWDERNTDLDPWLEVTGAVCPLDPNRVIVDLVECR